MANALVAGNSLFAMVMVTDTNGKLLESMARVQKEWAEFVHRRVKEDIAASQQLMNCQTMNEGVTRQPVARSALCCRSSAWPVAGVLRTRI
jgi:hypothetical protein